MPTIPSTSSSLAWNKLSCLRSSGGLAVAIKKSLRDTDIPVSYTRDNVLILMPHTEQSGAVVVAKRIVDRVQKSTLSLEGKKVKPKLSVGIASVRDLKTGSFAAMIQAASQHLREAKRLGGGRIAP